ncbi:SLC13 family permease [Goodfellowiella coeruleoviolacea]|uniref:Na+/H+ antiporter NhaD n=1 Tax=Goodfellowiella coeruleoviolacea TaxID=334858 RepID=A0AAE3GED1_9PSEU|nr:SLC13 family permease [Goodfellowiella coeruleoviolacea]MCP2165789.1 Na+/H+ antiporter NhaD [Goodfellowiella coeruleoviolacea]
MSAQLISILALVAVFAVATLMSVNMGALAFAAAFLVGTLAGGMSTDDVLAGFPGDIFVVLVGVTYLFAIARANGTIDWLVGSAVRAVGGRLAVIPWIMFAVTAALTAIGAVSPAAVAIVAPIALGCAARYGINPLLMGVLVVHGAQAGGFSPISVYGTIVNTVVARNNLPGNPVVLFLASLAVNLVIAVVVFVLFGGTKLARIAPGEVAEDEPERLGAPGAATAAELDQLGRPDQPGLNPHRVLTLLGLVALTVCTLVFDLDVGLVAITIAVLLGLASPGTHKTAINQITWPTVLLICGVLTYVGVLEKLGTIDYVGNAVSQIGAPMLAALVLCYIGAIVSAFASSVGLLGATIPLAVPFLAQGAVGPVGVIAALAVAATVVDVSPFSTNGAIVLANARTSDRDRFFRQLLTYGGVIAAAAPLLVWLVFVLPNLG